MNGVSSLFERAVRNLITRRDTREFRGERFASKWLLRFSSPWLWSLVVSGLFVLSVHAATVGPFDTTASQRQMERWASAKFERVLPVDTSASEPGLIVLANHDPVQWNSRAGQPMRLGEQTFTNGLYCHAPSRILVNLPAKAARFEATVGVDRNSDTSGNRGSVVFQLISDSGEKIYESPRMTEASPPETLNANLSGGTTFTLQITDAEDGNACDQADWANAVITLEDGKTMRLSELPCLATASPKPLDTTLPFSFIYDGKSSNETLDNWTRTFEKKELDAARTAWTQTFTDPATGLEVRCVAVTYADFPVAEWTLYFRNAGDRDTPIIEKIRSLDTGFARTAMNDFVLHHQTGSPCRADDFEPFADVMKPGTTKHIVTNGGRPTNDAFPYFNVENGTGGVLTVVSWAGQWDADFTAADTEMRVSFGQERTHFVLHPNEEVRSPMSVVLFYDGDFVTGQNIWRRWMLAHNVPRDAQGNLPINHLAACSSHQYGEMIHADTASQTMFIQGYLDRGLPLDYWWMDAGWYPNRGESWPDVGTWEVDRTRFPNGLAEISDYAHQRGVRTIVWFEPERTMRGRWIVDTHPEWVLAVNEANPTCLLNLGHPEALQWASDHFNALIDSEKIDLYRQDFNMDPLDYWRNADTEDRQGITEMKYVAGYYAYWDALRAKHPGMLIDTCASGGRRLDLETLRRSVPLLRSDFIMDPVGNQGHTYGLSFWLPYHGTGSSRTNAYDLWSVMHSFFTACFDMRPESDFTGDKAAATKALIDRWKSITPNFAGDYYPLMPYSLENSQWIAWQFNRPEAGTGMIQAFRRAESVYESVHVKLRGLEPEAKYQLLAVEPAVVNSTGSNSSPAAMTGRELMEHGISLSIDSQPGVFVLKYEKIN